MKKSQELKWFLPYQSSKGTFKYGFEMLDIHFLLIGRIVPSPLRGNLVLTQFVSIEFWQFE